MGRNHETRAECKVDMRIIETVYTGIGLEEINREVGIQGVTDVDVDASETSEQSLDGDINVDMLDELGVDTCEA